jgi:hypothetical protein
MSRYSLLMHSAKRMLSEDEAGDYVGCPAWLEKMVRAGWLKPIKWGKMKRYDRDDLDLCCDRLKKDERPEYRR